jgi:hypothetical protein
MIIFINPEKIGKLFSDLIDESVKADIEYYQKIKKREFEKQKLEEKKRLEKMKKEEEEHDLYYEQYLKDPTSVMICPFGWSPFGIYL